MIGAPVIACMTRQSTTSAMLFDSPIIVEVIVNRTNEAMNRPRMPKRAASQGVGGMPIAPATMLAVTIQEIWSRLTDRSPCICGSTTFGSVVPPP